MPDWTIGQKNAIEARGRNILVSAAAGSGKTAVLVERVIQMITNRENPVDIDSLLLVTFTNAAAAEMKYRISKSLTKLIRENPETAFYKRQLSLLPNAKICTIDAFCASLVKEHFYDLSISRDFSTMDESELQLLEENVISDVLDEFFEAGDSDFISLFEMFTVPGNEKPVVSAVRRLLRFIYSQPFPYKWLEDSISLHSPDIPFCDTVWYEYIKEETDCLLSYALELAENNLSLFENIDCDKKDRFTEVINDDITEITRFKNALNESWNDAVNQRPAKFATSPPVTKLEPAVAERYKSNREIYKSIIKTDIQNFFICAEEDYSSDANSVYRMLQALFRLIKAVDKRLFSEKKEMNTYSFSDIEHFAINLLFELKDDGTVKRTQLAENLSNEYYEILVDEYQDTNEAQDLLFTYLSNGHNLFTVGDIKQSIYRFRHAMPHIFNQKKKSYTAYDKTDSSVQSKIILDRNFRSRGGICSYVNFVFSNLMTERVGELDYNEEEYLNCGAVYNDTDIPCAQLNILTGVKGEDYDRLEASYIAKTIIKKINSGELIRDGDKYRPIKYGDFAILMRKVSGHIDTYSQTLAEFGIPVICDNSSNLFDNSEIKILLSFIKIIDNPIQDIPLLATMMSPVYGFTADEMAQIRIENKYNSLYSAVSGSSLKKAADFVRDLQRLRSISVSMSVASFIRYLIEDKGIIAYINAFGNGEQRYRNILKFISFAKKFDSGVNVGLTAFVRYIDKIASLDKGISAADISSAAENSVKIMSVHHSKGLEFPVCIFAGATRRYNNQDLNDKLMLNTKLGIGIKCHNEKQMYQYNSVPYTVLKNKNAAEMMSENLRVLYVAMTRAKEQFISFITVDSIENKIKKLAGNISDSKINPYICKKISNDGDFILMCALMHKDCRVLRDMTECDIKTAVSDFAVSVEITDDISLVKNNITAEFPEPDAKIVKQIENKLDFRYNRFELTKLSSKLTASSLDDADRGFDYLTAAKPSFLNKNGLTPAQRGTAMHTFMQYCDYSNAYNCLDAEIDRIISLGHITAEEAESLDKLKLNNFFRGSLAEKIFNADKVYREIKVSMFVSSKDLYNTEFDEKILVQGIADCVIEKDSVLTLIDYKTDNVSSEEELLERYRKQIMFYKTAVSKALSKPVVQTLLYSFKLGKCCYYK